MSIYAKVTFFLVIVLSFSLSYLFSKKKSIKALEKTLVLFYAILLILSVLFPEAIVLSVSQFLGVSKYIDAVLFLFMVLSLSFNFILTRKIVEMDRSIKKLVQNLSLKELQFQSLEKKN